MTNLRTIKRQATAQASDLLDQQGITRVPVDVVAICNRLGVKVTGEELDDDTSGVIVIKNGRAAIGYNANHHPNRQRFSIAHELGHFLLHANEGSFFVDSTFTFYRDQASSEGVYTQEIAANTFAAELLMPKRVLEDYLEDNAIDVHDPASVRHLAVKFKVSEQALMIRLVNLGLVSA